jgi:hypothetical protein
VRLRGWIRASGAHDAGIIYENDIIFALLGVTILDHNRVELLKRTLLELQIYLGNHDDVDTFHN